METFLVSRRHFLSSIMTLGISTLVFGKPKAAQPPAKEIFLFDCHIAGTYYARTAEVESSLNTGDRLVLKREPDNPHDPLAILILDAGGRKLGYVPRAKNEALARLMDGGKPTFARLQSKEWINDWLKIQVHVYMYD